MAKVSKNPIKSYDQDWGNDTSNGMPYSGEAIQKFIKDELKDKLSQADAGTKVKEQLKSQLFGGGTNNVVTEVSGNSEVLTIKSRNSEGNEITEDINISTPDTQDRFVAVTAKLSNQYINVGGEVKLAFGFTVTDYQGEIIPNSNASVSLEISKQGSSNPFYRTSLGILNSAVNNQTPNHEIDLTSIISNNVTGSASIIATVTVRYTYDIEDEEGIKTPKTIVKYGSTTLTVLALSLSTSINIVNTGLTGQVSIPYTVKGNGSKTVYLYVNGVLSDQHSDITSASSSGQFIRTLNSGISNFQIVAETTAGSTTVRSSSYYFDLFSSITSTVIALMVQDTTGSIFDTNYNNPVFKAPKFSDFKFNYYVYSKGNPSVDTEIITDELDSDSKVIISSKSNQTLNRRAYTYSKKIKTSNRLKVTFKTDDTTRIIYIDPLKSSINIELPTESLKLNLDADGRNNEEVNPSSWTYGNITTTFSGLNWESNGWIDNTLLLQNGAKAIINFPLFQSDSEGHSVATKGCAFEILFKCNNATLDEHDIISCHWKNNEGATTGLNITTSYVGVDTGEKTVYTNEDKTDDEGKPLTQEVTTRVGSLYAQNNWYKYAFVIDPDAPSVGSNKGLCYGYLNGVLSYIAPIPSSFINLDKIPIVLDSTYADVYVKSIKYYDAPLTHDQCVDEYIIDQETAVEIETLYNKNNVIDSGKVSPSKLRSMGRGVMIISPSTEQTTRTYLQDLNKSTDKKSYFGPFRIDYYAPETDLNLGYSTVPIKGNQYNFTHTQCAIRIQGTTSTKRPRKNYRVHFSKKNKEEKPAADSFIVGGVPTGTNFKYSMSENAVAVPIACLKVDYVDSSMTHNTGGAVIFNELTRNIEALRNPAQIREYKDSATDIKTRVAVEGFPIDVFAADGLASPNDEGEYREILDDSRYSNLVYMGQYNYNNDKSKSGKVFGFDGSYKYDEDGTYNEVGAYQPICIEFLDNNAALDLFQVKFTTENNIDEPSTYENFANSLEVRAPSDVTDQIEDFGLDSLTTAEGFDEYRYIPDQIKRLFNFIGECAAQVASNNGKTPKDLNTMTSEDFEALNWSSEKFLNEAKDYFNLSSIFAWYIWTDYLIAVDQRAKNMMLYTMDGKHWLFQYYDGDTILGERNDCFLAYDYLTDRTTYDNAVGQYALQGHDSWLWYLVRANFSSKTYITDSGGNSEADPRTAINLASVCQSMRRSGKFSADYFKQVLNGQFVNNYSQRQYNYSQDYKYVQPLTESGYPTDIGTNFINTAQGSREAHRTFTLVNRFSLLDSKYQAGGYSQDSFIYYAAVGHTNRLKIISSIPYYFGWNTSNTSIRQHQVANASNNYTVELEITGNAANNPANVLGASRIKELYFIGNDTAWTVDETKTVKLPNLHKLVASSMGNRAVGPLWLENCPLLTYIDLHSSNFTELNGLKNCSKLIYIDVENTNISSIKFADGSPLETIKLAAPTEVYLSNLSKIVFNNSGIDTITAQNWDSLSKLLINNCPQVDWEKMVLKLLNSTAKHKYLRITNINKTDAITWLDNFNNIKGLDSNGAELDTGAQLIGTLQLLDYTDDIIVDKYKAKFPNLNIKQPEYTIIETNETIADESSTTENSRGSTTNLDNNTGYSFSNTYKPSGHIKSILDRCHRYLGKLITPGNSVTFIGNPNDPSPLGQKFQGRDSSGTMLLCQLADANSTYFNTGYTSSSTRRTANLDGKIGNGEVYVKIPGFWYKGINYVPAINSQNVSFRYTCYSSYEEKPSVSEETRSLSIDSLKQTPIDAGNDEGLYKENTILEYTEVANSIEDRENQNTGTDVYRVNVRGYKKIRFPASIGTGCCLFTDENGKIITSSTGSVINVGEIFTGYANWLYTGMPVIATVPSNATYFYLTVKKFIQNEITSDPCDIVLHRGSKFNSGDEMTNRNARSWIADMEPDWVYSDPVCIAAGECAEDELGDLYSPFDGLVQAARGTSDVTHPDLKEKGVWHQYSMREAAYKRGLQLIDYEATKLIANLFIAKYGRRNSQNQLGAGTKTPFRKIGKTREYGITDTVIPNGVIVTDIYDNATIPIIKNGDITFIDVESPNFLGIENVHGNVREFLERGYITNETNADFNKITLINPDLSIRKLYWSAPSYRFPRSLVHGKYCDIVSASSKEGTEITFYPDYQVRDTGNTIIDQWKNTFSIVRSGYNSFIRNGVFYLYAFKVNESINVDGSRLIFRGNIIETADIDEFMESSEYRGRE